MTPRSSGPSPRVRGNRAIPAADESGDGSIPACAGKPLPALGPPPENRVHPRVCGETAAGGEQAILAAGPSPRVRGNRGGAAGAGCAGGSIPACAGKPQPMRRRRQLPGVHPRVCGETATAKTGRQALAGPSPRVRGNPGPPPPNLWLGGSIPACAGKPMVLVVVVRMTGVHPRVCGETGPPSAQPTAWPGPSPRVRGNRILSRNQTPSAGSIPACAGKPSSRPDRSRRSGVHPRVCGETASIRPASVLLPGPSPRVRGNRLPDARDLHRHGSIPACAGKPPGS